MKLSTAFCIAFCFLCRWAATSDGQITNGNFESSFYGTGVPSGWKANAGDGNSNLQDTTHLSPFTNIYPSSVNSVRLTDGSTNDVFPNLVQDFAPAASLFNLSFDFSLDAVSDAAWRLRVGRGSSTDFDILINAASTLQFAGSTNATIATLTPGSWYQFAATVNDTTRSISGSLTPFNGTPVSFSGSLYLNGPASAEEVLFQDFSANQNPTLYLDNVSVRTAPTVPEPSTVGLLVSGLVLLYVFRSRFSRRGGYGVRTAKGHI